MARGRGKHYTPLRRTSEEILRSLYWRDWPARLLARLPAANRVTVVEHRLALLPAGCPRLRLAFASDIHLGPTTSLNLIERAFDRLAEARPDVLVLGGDYVYLDVQAHQERILSRLVRSVKAPVIVAVLGNHDLWTEHARIEATLGEAGARVLINDAIRLPKPWADLALAGLDDPWVGDADAQSMLNACGDARFIATVCHSPEAINVLSPGRVGLLLCGHTHGGQLALPGPRPIVLPPGKACRPYPFGLHDVDGTHLWVSRGLGNTEIPVRTFAPPDVAIFDLCAAP
jgi:predicted MPP superfamily phosphohydrolase